MKKLLLVRHAKSDWDNPKLSDFERPLNQRGHKNAPEMALRILKKKIIPQQIVSSPATRALTTAEYFAEVFQVKKSTIVKEESIYEASSNTLLKIINRLSNDYDFIALFGHNPGITHLINGLSNADISNVPTCGMALIEFPFDDWSMISAGTGQLSLFDYPKNAED
jgi:phosphohistidine phosphatase